MRPSLPVDIGTASQPTAVEAVYPVHNVVTHAKVEHDANHFLGNGVLFEVPATATNVDILASMRGIAYWADGGSSNIILPSFKPVNDSIIIRVITADLIGYNLCWPRPGFLTYENIDRTTLTDDVKPLLKGQLAYVREGAALGRAALVTPLNFVLPPILPPPPFFGFVMKMWKVTGEQLIYPHVYLHQFRILNSDIRAQNPVYQTLRFGLSDSVGSAVGVTQAPANDPHDLYLVHRRLLDLGFKISPFEDANRWKTAVCVHRNGDSAAHETGEGAHVNGGGGGNDWAYNKHPPDFRAVDAYHSGAAVSATLSAMVLAATASNVANHYVGMYVEITGGAAAGQFRRIDGYAAATRTITVATPWSALPPAGSTYSIIDFTEGGAVIDTLKLVERLLLNSRTDPVASGTGRLIVTKNGTNVTLRSFTERWLWADKAPQWTELDDGPGHHESDGRSGDTNHHKLDFHYATNYTKEAIRAAGLEYYRSYLQRYPGKALIDTNDASYKGGGVNCEHAWHSTGLDVDIRLPRTTTVGGFNTGGVKFDEVGYDRRTAFWICRSLTSTRGVSGIYFNDPKIYRGSAGDEYHTGVAMGAGGAAPAGDQGTIGWIELSAAASSEADEYKSMEIEITAGAGLGEKRTIAGYNGTSKTATVTVPWLPTALPAQGSSYKIWAKVADVAFSSGHNDHIHANVNPPSVADTTPVTTQVRYPGTWGAVVNGVSVFDGLK